MAPGRSTEPEDPTGLLLARYGGTLLRVAQCAIAHGLAYGRRLDIDPRSYAPELRDKRATFVTLELAGKLRGCIGKSVACNPLVSDVAENAYAAAFEDGRFEALTETEADNADIKLSVLSDLEPLTFADEPDLLARLRPGTDGVMIEHGSNRGIFLPDVWDKVADPRGFLDQLKTKAGLPADFWSDDIAAYRFTTASTSLSRRAGAA